jgi:hypothetical protein
VRLGASERRPKFDDAAASLPETDLGLRTSDIDPATVIR